MSYTHYLREIGRGAHGARALSETDAYALFGAMLDGGVPDMELGAIVMAMRVKTESPEELLGFHQAASERINYLQPPLRGPRPIVLPSYNGARRHANLTPLLALLLQRFRVPVLVHGLLEGFGRVTSAHIFRELGILPGATVSQVQTAMNADGLAFAPTSVLSPGLANLLALRTRLGVRNSAHTLVKLIEPFGTGVPVVSVSHPAFLDKLREFFSYTRADSLLLRGSEGEPYANPRRRPRIEAWHNGSLELLFEAEHGTLNELPHLPQAFDAISTAAWIRDALAGNVPLPTPIVNQLACCLYMSGYTDDLNHAKAMAAVETSTLAAA